MARVLKKVQDENPDLRISLTLPVLPTGLTPDGEEIVKIMQDNGLGNLQINAMTMDFGSAIADMGQAVIKAYQSLIKQIGNYSAAITPMIGVQDSANETFTLKDAEAVTARCLRTCHCFGLLLEMINATGLMSKVPRLNILEAQDNTMAY